MKIQALSTQLAVSVLFFVGCRSGAAEHAATHQVNRPPQWHTVAMPATTNHPSIHWYAKSNPIWWLGNADDTTPPSWYEPGNSLRTVMWYVRNPFHNFDYYIIGVADKNTHRSGRYPALVGNPDCGWNFAVTRWKFLYFPFVDYKSKSNRFEFYFGWREKGDFGIKATYRRHPIDVPLPKPQKENGAPPMDEVSLNAP